VKLSENGLKLLKSFEGFRPNAYLDDDRRTKDRLEHSIGYGHQIGRHEGHYLQKPISENVASVLLQHDVKKAEEYVKQFGSFNQNQFDALVLMAYNLGSFGENLISLLKAKNWKKVPDKMMEYVKQGDRTLPHLVKRRKIEAELFASTESNAKHLLIGVLALIAIFFIR
jgi:lysozyme